ncbi:MULTISPECIES: sulfite exporter TauE/SafE family protein [unclassified Knoellia]|uniref:sulfite exporter TauE/SafE family protein n=1 Tax=Knoellia altitudinis TaxID=3404795 RepID=UPI0036090552
MIDWPLVLGLGVALLTGAFVQSSIGFGMSVVAAPFVVVLAPDLMPGALLVTSFSLPIVQLSMAPVDIAWRSLSWALLGRLLLTPVGVAVVAVLSVRSISVIVAVLILLTVATSLTTIRIRNTPVTAGVAGGLAGVWGTATSIGGPFLALVLQHEKPDRLRATLAAFFLIGSTLSAAGLVLLGEFTDEQLVTGLVWIPFLLLGYAAASPLRARLDTERLRRAVLAFCVLAGVSILVRAFVF